MISAGVQTRTGCVEMLSTSPLTSRRQTRELMLAILESLLLKTLSLCQTRRCLLFDLVYKTDQAAHLVRLLGIYSRLVLVSGPETDTPTLNPSPDQADLVAVCHSLGFRVLFRSNSLEGIAYDNYNNDITMNSDLIRRNENLVNFLSALPIDDVGVVMEAVFAGLGDSPRIASDVLLRLLSESELVDSVLKAKASANTKISTLVDKTYTEAALLAHVAEFGFHRYGPRNPVFEFVGCAFKSISGLASGLASGLSSGLKDRLQYVPRCSDWSVAAIRLDDDWVDLGTTSSSRWVDTTREIRTRD